MILLQGSLAFSRVHLWRWWRVSIEAFVAVHAAAVAYFVQLHRTLWRMFLFGFLFIFIGTQMWGVPIGGTPGRAAAGGVYLAAVAFTYWYQGSRPGELNEIIRIPFIEYILVFLCWAVVAVSYAVVRAAASPVDPAAGGSAALFAGGMVTLLFVLMTWGLSEGIEWKMRQKARKQQLQGLVPPLSLHGAGGDAGEEGASMMGASTAKAEAKAGAKAGAKASTVYTLEQVARHNTVDDCFLVISGHVFDVTAWMARHPGGKAVLLQRAGTDCTKAFFAAYHSQHTKETLIGSFRVGVVGSGEDVSGSGGGGGGGGGSGYEGTAMDGASGGDYVALQGKG